MAGRWGKCTNFGNCSIADSKTLVQEQTGKGFVCTECNRPLVSVKGESSGGGNAKTLGLIVGVVLLLSLLGAGGYWLIKKISPADTEPAVATAAPAAPVSTSGKSSTLLNLVGSNTIGKELAPLLAENFLHRQGAQSVRREQPSDTEILIHGKIAGKPQTIRIVAQGSSTAFQALGAQQADIGMSSREIKPEEAQRLSDLGDLTSVANEHVLAVDGLAIIVPRANPLNSLSREQLKAIFSGQISDWRALKGRPGKITIHAFDDKSGTFDSFKSLVLLDTRLTRDAQRYEDSRQLSDAVAADPNAIGFVGMSFIGANKALAIGEAGARALVPNRFTVKTEDYPLSRRLYLYTGDNSKNAYGRKFIEFALSRDGQEYVRKAGFVELNVEAAGAGDSPSIPTDAPSEYKKFTTNAKRLSLNFRFRSGSDALDNKALQDLDRVTDLLSDLGIANNGVMLFGFADSRGIPAINQQLSERRAQTVAQQFRQRGISPAVIKSFGASMPIASNATPYGQEKNRRVEIWVKKN